MGAPSCLRRVRKRTTAAVHSYENYKVLPDACKTMDLLLRSALNRSHR